MAGVLSGRGRTAHWDLRLLPPPTERLEKLGQPFERREFVR